MSESKWTRGPWECDTDQDDEDPNYGRVRSAQVIDSNGRVVCEFSNADGELTYEDDGEGGGSYFDHTKRANARLISAAPDLAEVAEELIRIDANLTGQDRDDAMSDLIVKARAALAKAGGETT